MVRELLMNNELSSGTVVTCLYRQDVTVLEVMGAEASFNSEDVLI